MDPRLGANAPLGPWSADGVGSTLEPYEVSTDNPVYARGDHRRGGHCLHRAFCGRGLDGDPHWRLVCCAHRAESAQPQEFARPQSGHSAQSIVFVPGHLPVERYQPQRADAAGGTTPLGATIRAHVTTFSRRRFESRCGGAAELNSRRAGAPQCASPRPSFGVLGKRRPGGSTRCDPTSSSSCGWAMRVRKSRPRCASGSSRVPTSWTVGRTGLIRSRRLALVVVRPSDASK